MWTYYAYRTLSCYACVYETLWNILITLLLTGLEIHLTVRWDWSRVIFEVASLFILSSLSRISLTWRNTSSCALLWFFTLTFLLRCTKILCKNVSRGIQGSVEIILWAIARLMALFLRGIFRSVHRGRKPRLKTSLPRQARAREPDINGGQKSCRHRRPSFQLPESTLLPDCYFYDCGNNHYGRG